MSLSHEALEMVADPDVNLLVVGPHPRTTGASALFWYEICDAVQTETYLIDGVRVSNFLLPLYFTNTDEMGSRNDFLGNAYNGQTLRSFGTIRAAIKATTMSPAASTACICLEETSLR